MRKNILFGGKAGQGANELANVISGALARAGFYTFNSRDYQSRIRGGHGFNVVCFSDRETRSNDESIDILVALDKLTYVLHKKQLKDNSIIITSDAEVNEQAKAVYTTPSGRSANMAFAGLLFKIFGLDKKFLLEEIQERFKGNKFIEEDLTAAETYYEKDYEYNLQLKSSEPKGIVLTGSEAIAFGAIDAGVEIYFGYPMTPSTEVLNTLAQMQKKNKKLVVFTPENEIATINASLGASFAGKRVMTGTAGGGYDLMTEAVSMQGIMELPLVLHLAQRVGPGTGAPTYTSQSDTNVALYGGHGEFSRVVITPGDAEEAYKKTYEAFYLSEKFGVLSILLTDKHLTDSHYVDKISLPHLEIPKRKEFAGNGVFKRTSYEHDEFWNTTEEADDIKYAVEQRKKRDKLIESEVEKLTTYKKFGSGNNLIISCGSTKGAILDSLNELKGFSYLHLMYLQPFPKIMKYLRHTKNIFVIENNATGVLADLIERKTPIKITNYSRILKYDGRPFTPGEIVEEVKKRMKNV